MERIRWMWRKNPVNSTEKEPRRWESMALKRPKVCMAYERMLRPQGIYDWKAAGATRKPRLTSPKHLRGKAISPKAPRPQTRTARRSVPISEVIGRNPGGQNPNVSDGVKTMKHAGLKTTGDSEEHCPLGFLRNPTGVPPLRHLPCDEGYEFFPRCPPFSGPTRQTTGPR